MEYKNIKKFITSFTAVCVAVLIIGITLFIKKTEVRAQTSASLPFGGQIEDVEYCCDGSILLTVGPPIFGFYDYRPGVSMLYENYQIFTEGPYVLGTALPGGYCDLVDADCEAGIEADTIQIIGTSSL